VRANRISALIIALILAGAGTVFIKTLLPALQTSTDPNLREHRAVSPLMFAEQKESLLAESGLDGHHDVRVENHSDKLVTLGMEAKDCQCLHPQICSEAENSSLVWVTLDEAAKEFTMPPHGVGRLRLQWKGEKLGDHLFWVNLWVREGDYQGHQRLELPVYFFDAVRIRAEDDVKKTETDVGLLRAGEERVARLLCYSATRKQFTLTPSPSSDDPCFLYGEPKPLTAEELQALSAKSDWPILTGYRVSVTVREQVGHRQLDLGPFRQSVTWKTDIAADHKITSHVSGNVEGEVKLVAGDGNSVVDLGTISASAPKPVVFTLMANDPRLQLTLEEEKTLEFLSVELLDGQQGKPADGGKSWRVRVVYKTDSLFRGKFPDRNRPGYEFAAQCAIAFVISHVGQPVKQPARRLRVPVRGTVPGI
jgi:hypothetical protein